MEQQLPYDPNKLLPEVEPTRWDFQLPLNELRGLFGDLNRNLDQARTLSQQAVGMVPPAGAAPPISVAPPPTLVDPTEVQGALTQALLATANVGGAAAQQATVTPVAPPIAAATPSFSQVFATSLAAGTQQAYATTNLATALSQQSVIQATQATQQAIASTQVGLQQAFQATNIAANTVQQATIQAAQIARQVLAPPISAPGVDITPPESLMMKAMRFGSGIVSGLASASEAITTIGGAAIGTAVAGPVGAAIGAAVGAMAGAWTRPFLETAALPLESPRTLYTLEALNRSMPTVFSVSAPAITQQLYNFAISAFASTGQMPSPGELEGIVYAALQSGFVAQRYGTHITTQQLSQALDDLLNNIQRLMDTMNLRVEQALQILQQVGWAGEQFATQVAILGRRAGPAGQAVLPTMRTVGQMGVQLGLPVQWPWEIYTTTVLPQALNLSSDPQAVARLAQEQVIGMGRQLGPMLPAIYGAAQMGLWQAYTQGMVSLPELMLYGAAGFIQGGTPQDILSSRMMVSLGLVPQTGATEAMRRMQEWGMGLLGMNAQDPLARASFIAAQYQAMGIPISGQDAIMMVLNMETAGGAQEAIAAMRLGEVYRNQMGLLDRWTWAIRENATAVARAVIGPEFAETIADVHRWSRSLWRRATTWGFLGAFFVPGLAEMPQLTPYELELIRARTGQTPMQRVGTMLMERAIERTRERIEAALRDPDRAASVAQSVAASGEVTLEQLGVPVEESAVSPQSFAIGAVTRADVTAWVGNESSLRAQMYSQALVDNDLINKFLENVKQAIPHWSAGMTAMEMGKTAAEQLQRTSLPQLLTLDLERGNLERAEAGIQTARIVASQATDEWAALGELIMLRQENTAIAEAAFEHIEWSEEMKPVAQLLWSTAKVSKIVEQAVAKYKETGGTIPLMEALIQAVQAEIDVDRDTAAKVAGMLVKTPIAQRLLQQMVQRGDLKAKDITAIGVRPGPEEIRQAIKEAEDEYKQIANRLGVGGLLKPEEIRERAAEFVGAGELGQTIRKMAQGSPLSEDEWAVIRAYLGEEFAERLRGTPLSERRELARSIMDVVQTSAAAKPFATESGVIRTSPLKPGAEGIAEEAWWDLMAQFSGNTLDLAKIVAELKGK